MKALPWCFSLILFGNSLTSGLAIYSEDPHESRSVCCEVGRRLAENSNGCNTASIRIPSTEEISPDSCQGFMRKCCRNKLKEKDCLVGKAAALANQTCENLQKTASEDCCVACKAGLSSKTCVAPWLEDDLKSLNAFGSCCQIARQNETRETHLDSDMLRMKRTGPVAVKCRDGFFYDRESSACKDIDECSLNKNHCPDESLCSNTEGGYECIKSGLQREEIIPECAPGLVYNRHLRDCIDIDECAADLHNCKPATEVCLNQDGGFVCRPYFSRNCGVGYVFKNGLGCQDEDECSVPNGCSPEEICVNRGGHYICVPSCGKGLKIDPVTVECTDIDECATGTHNCTQTQECSNTEGSFSCRESNLVDPCQKGFQRNAQDECKDIDECAIKSHNCSATEKCVNLEGGFVCIEQCQRGYQLNEAGSCEDIDECATKFPCRSSSEVCRNTQGGYECHCKEGFEKVGVTCADIDECKRRWKPCGERATCVNTIGSFSCAASCGEGYHHVNGTCIDKNECEELNKPCLNGQQCENLPGTYKCVDRDCELLGKVPAPDGGCLLRRTCRPGFRHDPGMDNCVDRNECAEQYPSACPVNAYCQNTIGSFVCIPIAVECETGMRRTPDGTRCENIDECSEGLHNCDLTSEECVDTTGSFVCTCKDDFDDNGVGTCVPRIKSQCPSGFRQDGSPWKCKDINECEDPNICEHECKNTVGSYECRCKAGFEPDKRNKARCVDINECRRGLCPGVCVNTPGSYKCSCPTGYQMKNNTCVDVNECLNPRKHHCQSPDTCLNVIGGFRCISHECPSNYTKDSFGTMRCVRDVPCLDQSHCSLDPDLIVFNYIPLKRGSIGRPASVRITGPSNVHVEFSLHVSKVISYKVGLVEATDENFLLKPGKTSAKVFIRNRVFGPQDVYLTLKAKLYNRREGPPVGRELFKIVEWRIVLFVPAHDI